MFGRFFGKGPRRCGRQHRHHQHDRCCTHPLSDFAPGADVTVCNNVDRKTVEMGLFSGARVHILQNHVSESNLVIAIGDSRYTVPREIAQTIMVR